MEYKFDDEHLDLVKEQVWECQKEFPYQSWLVLKNLK